MGCKGRETEQLPCSHPSCRRIITPCTYRKNLEVPTCCDGTPNSWFSPANEPLSLLRTLLGFPIEARAVAVIGPWLLPLPARTCVCP